MIEGASSIYDSKQDKSTNPGLIRDQVENVRDEESPVLVTVMRGTASTPPVWKRPSRLPCEMHSLEAAPPPPAALSA